MMAESIRELRTFLLWSCVLAILLVSGTARAQSLEVHVEDLLGGQCGQSWGTVLVSITNSGRSARSGELVAHGRRSGLHELRRPFTLPAGQSTEVRLQVPPNWCDLQFCVDIDGSRRCAPSGGSWSDSRGDRNPDVLVVQDNLELRPAFSVIQTTDDLNNGPSRPSGSRSLRVALARISGEDRVPMLAEETAGYAHLRLIVAEADLLDRVSRRERQALQRWVQTGGELAVVTIGVEQVLASQTIGALLPDLESGPGPLKVLYSPNLTTLFRASGSSLARCRSAAAALCLRGPGLIEQPYGASQDVGLGRVHVLVTSPDAELEGYPEATNAAQSALESLLNRRHTIPVTTWRHVPLESASRGSLDGHYRFNGTNEINAAQDLHLDANQEHQLPLWVLLLVVLACTTGIFLIQRSWARGGRGVSKLVGPIALVALAGCLSIFLMSYAARGRGNSYRSMAWIEAASGQQVGTMWRRLALAFDAPGVYPLTLAPELQITAPHATTRFDGAEEVLEVSGGRWETVVATEHGTVDLDGAVEIEWGEDGRPRSVVNGLDSPLVNVRLFFGTDVHGPHVWDLGRLEPGQRVELSERSNHYDYSLPAYVPQTIRNWTNTSREGLAAVVGEFEWECPDRGSFGGDQCHTTLVVWGER